MGSASPVLRERAKTASVKSGPPKGQIVRHILPFESFLREIWPQDRTKNYMRLTGTPERTAKRRISGRHPPDYAEILAMLRSKHGLAFLERALGDDPPEWFVGFKRAKNIGDMRRRQAQLQREIAQIEMQIEQPGI